MGSIANIEALDWRTLPSIIGPPKAEEDYDAWLGALTMARRNAGTDLALDKAPIAHPDLAWARRCFTCAKIMTWDRKFLDPDLGRYHVEPYLDYGNERFGGFDAVVLWQAYPRIGFDRRNQFDFYRELPGGVKGLRDVVERFHDAGTKFFIDYNPWDIGTRREGKSDGEAIRELVDTIEADGVFLDTLREGDPSLRKALIEKGRPMALESELDLPPTALADHALSWMQWPQPPDLLGVLRNHWLSPTHMQHVIRRWDRYHFHEIALAWLNGVGMLVWENIFGSWNGWNDRDAETLKAARQFVKRHERYFTQGDFRPFTPDFPGALASQWRLGSQCVWAVANPTETNVHLQTPDGWKIEGPPFVGPKSLVGIVGSL